MQKGRNLARQPGQFRAQVMSSRGFGRSTSLELAEARALSAGRISVDRSIREPRTISGAGRGRHTIYHATGTGEWSKMGLAKIPGI